MKCYNHASLEGVGICKQCGRSICHDCIAPDVRSVACKNRCEQHVERLDGFLERSVFNQFNATFVGSLIVSVMLIFLGYIISLYDSMQSPLTWGLWGIGFIFFLNALRYRGRGSKKQ